MTEKGAAKAVRATRRNYNFGTAVIFEGRCIQAWPQEDGTFTLSSGCYTTTEGLPEFDAMKNAGTQSFRTTDMGGGLVKVSAEMTEEQFKKYLMAADEADWEA